MKTTHATGVALVCISALIFSTAGIFTKGVDADAWTVIFWRGLSAAVFILGATLWAGTFKLELDRFGFSAILATLLMSSGTAAFIPAFKLTSVANVALIWAAAPLVTAMLAWLAIKERPTKRVLIASIIALIGVVILVGGSLGSGNLIGDLLAVWMTLMMAATFVVYRVWPETPVALPAALSSVLLLPFALLLANPFQIPGTEISVLIGFGLVFAVASVTMLEGVRRIPAAEAALLGALETPLAPIWAFLLLAEVPLPATLLGAAITFPAIIWSQLKTR